ncbi:hypothetical protein FYK55_05055 [Roseiconus nitratireducens]|uniref:Uncharacterized protein n=1 Tax=Roseiconus nitratireducens TaxID=2605748 RepID=A0A5M6DFD1_9BACT|nr:hypothetical protein [Roseiconus nitratireducens]KAA5546257.1 hypothetical protein FYK55_05055 [Roseiconus nitratireducens]
MTPEYRTDRDQTARLAESRLPARSIYLTRDQAVRWLEQLNRLTASDRTAADLREMRNSLEEACWLARWKREEVILEMCPSTLASVAQRLMQITHGESRIGDLHVLEDMIEALSWFDHHGDR